MYDLIVRAKDNDNDAMLELIKKFRPLMLKYARKLNYEDAYEDILLDFIRLVKSGVMDKLGSEQDDEQNKRVISYIEECVKNFYRKKIREAINSKKEIVLSNLTDEQLYYVKAQLIQTDESDILIEFGMEQLLSREEGEVLYLVYVKGYSSAEIARKWNKSRQAVNQLKKRALQKMIDKMVKTD